MRKIISALLCLTLLLSAASAFAEETTGFADFSEIFAEQFLAPGEEIIKTETSYQSQNISINVTVSRVDRSDVYVADIYVRTPEYLQRAFGGGKWKYKMQKVKTIAEDNGALLALTGDNGHNFSSGLVFANGALKRKTANKKRDLCVLYKSGEMVTFKGAQIDTKALIADVDNIWQSFLFGPALLEDGAAVEKFSSSVAAANPRAAIGYFEPGHYCLVQVDGRGTKSAVETGNKSVGMTLKQLSAFMAELGCKTAYNLDGGQSALMWFGGEVISTPYNGGRSIGDILIIKELGAE